MPFIGVLLVETRRLIHHARGYTVSRSPKHNPWKGLRDKCCFSCCRGKEYLYPVGVLSSKISKSMQKEKVRRVQRANPAKLVFSPGILPAELHQSYQMAENSPENPKTRAKFLSIIRQQRCTCVFPCQLKALFLHDLTVSVVAEEVIHSRGTSQWQPLDGLQ